MTKDFTAEGRALACFFVFVFCFLFFRENEGEKRWGREKGEIVGGGKEEMKEDRIYKPERMTISPSKRTIKEAGSLYCGTLSALTRPLPTFFSKTG